MATQTLYRKATVSRADATASLFKRFPNADLVSFEHKAATAEEAVSAGAKEGDAIFAATIRVAEFPPTDDSSSDDSGDSSEAPAPKKEKPEGDESSDDSTDDSTDPKPEFGGGEGDSEGHEPKKLSPEEETNHLLQQILDALRGGAGPAGGPGDDIGAPALPDIGAPDQGEALPPPGGPAGAGAPLPPPVKQKSPLGVGSFAHYDRSKSEITVVRTDASALGNRGMIAEAREVYPTHKVAKIQRTGSATINGETIKLAERNIAVVTLIADPDSE